MKLSLYFYWDVVPCYPGESAHDRVRIFLEENYSITQFTAVVSGVRGWNVEFTDPRQELLFRVKYSQYIG